MQQIRLTAATLQLPDSVLEKIFLLLLSTDRQSCGSLAGTCKGHYRVFSQLPNPDNPTEKLKHTLYERATADFAQELLVSSRQARVDASRPQRPAPLTQPHCY